jgi:succinate-semialdehyde dehydrogenase/glutarate-semialdehyde dehydrogenase
MRLHLRDAARTKAGSVAPYHADPAQRLLSDEKVAIDGVDAWVSYEPIGLVLAGGHVIDAPGCYFEPTVVANAAPGMAVFDEETFGPAAAIAVARADAHAIELANATPFGLSVSIWTGSTERGVRLAKRITSGAAFINAVTASDARVPFGGTKKSGYGRELAAAGVREFCNVRTYWAAGQA